MKSASGIATHDMLLCHPRSNGPLGVPSRLCYNLLLLLCLVSALLCAPLHAAPPAKPTKPASPAPPADAGRVIVHTCWSPSSLYFAFDVDDTVIMGNQTAPMSQPWLDDAVAVYLNLDPSRAGELDNNCYRVVISAAGGASVQRGDHGVWRDDPRWFQFSEHGTIRYGVKVDGKLNDAQSKSKGYTVAIGLAWELLGVDPPILEHEHDPLPALGFALVCYSQGETQSVSCWPHALHEADLLQPAKWGLLQFTQNSQLVDSREPLASATLAADPTIDGELRVENWITAGVQVFRKAWGETPAAIPGRQNVSVLAAEYLLTPPEHDALHQPYQPYGPWLGPDSPLYHSRQLRDIKGAGIDALAVVLPADSRAREPVRRNLIALVKAISDYDQAYSTTFQCNAPLLLPMIDFSTALLDLRSEEGQATLATALDDFYRLVPPQYRLTFSNPSGTLCAPVILTAPAPTVSWDATFAERINSRFAAQWGMPIGWMPDRHWKTDTALPGVLSYCNWDQNSVLQMGEGSLSSAMIAPGFAATHTEHVSRRNGEVYENGWLKIAGASPDFILLRSWNDFTRASDVAPSRQYGYQFVDSTKLATLRLANRRGFGVRLMSHTLPRVMLPGQDYPAEVTVKNGTLTKMVAREGFRVDYRIMHGTDKIADGIATEKIVLFELATARLHFNLFTGTDRQHPLPAGEYVLYLDFRRNRVPFLSLPFMTQTLGTLIIPFTVSTAHDTVQVIRNEAPTDVASGSVQSITLQLRNLTPETWRKGKTYLHARWSTADGTAASAEVGFPCKQPVLPGDVITLHEALPPAPQHPGWYHLQLLYRYNAGKEEEVDRSAALVSDAKLHAQFMSIEFPSAISAQEKEVEVPIALRNPGSTPWPAKESRVVYQWLSWDGQILPGATGSTPLSENVKANGALTLRMIVAPPPGSGVFRCAFTLESGERMALLHTNPSTMVMPISQVNVRPAKFLSVDLKKVFNGVAASAETVIQHADVDGSGNAFPLEEFLPDATNPPLGYQPGYYVEPPDAMAAGFHFATLEDGCAPLLRANGQEIALPACAGSALHLAALNTGMTNPAQFVIRYTDGADVTIPVNISNWLEQPAYHEPVLLRSHYLRTSRGEDWYLQGSIFTYRLPLDPARTVKSILLPKATEVCLFALTLELPETPEKGK